MADCEKCERPFFLLPVNHLAFEAWQYLNMGSRVEIGTLKYSDILLTVSEFGGCKQDIAKIIFLESKFLEFTGHGNGQTR